MFVDASAIVAILIRECGHEILLDCLQAASTPSTSGVAVFEAALAIARLQAVPLNVAEAAVMKFLTEARVTLVSITAAETAAALAAHARYGKGRHPARLNLGDCLAYACAQVHGVPLLYVGDDFPQTDIRSALA
ncbi:type II toxin-antitoxin system VapC family toxin [Methylobacterium sp. P31]